MKEIVLVTPTQEYGIKETLEIDILLARTASIADQSLEDGKFNLMDFPRFISIFPLIGAAVEGAKEVPKELGDLDDQERELLNQAFAAELDLRNDQVEEVAEDLHAAGFHLAQVITKLAKLRRPETVA